MVVDPGGVTQHVSAPARAVPPVSAVAFATKPAPGVDSVTNDLKSDLKSDH
jgi:hypothetical protein